MRVGSSVFDEGCADEGNALIVIVIVAVLTAALTAFAATILATTLAAAIVRIWVKVEDDDRMFVAVLVDVPVAHDLNFARIKQQSSKLAERGREID